jgi:hypothetical protein
MEPGILHFAAYGANAARVRAKCCGFSLIDVSPRVFSDLTLALYRLTKAA